MTASQPAQKKLYIVLVSVHGLIRGHNLELGRDADTGGQTKYVLELARALITHPDVERVDLLTRQIFDPKVDPDYSQAVEELAPGAFIIRIPCGPRRYLRKEVLWPHLDAFIDNTLKHVGNVGRTPDVVHSHYADAGYVCSRLSQLLGAPYLHTGHSLGRVKLQRMLDHGIKPEVIEGQYNMNQRIEAEEIALGNADLVIVSTLQEEREQYSQYENYHPKRMVVIPPGVDLIRFRPNRRGEAKPKILSELAKFLENPRKPIILALSRPDERKNIKTLIHAYGENRDLQEQANLVVIAGNREDITQMEKGPRSVLSEMLMLIDRYDLYGSVAYPKHHEPSDVPDLYRLVAKTKGVFINPALTEPFGLTLLEAAACGAPIVATNDGGPSEIISKCRNGVLIDPLDADRMGDVLLEVVNNAPQWNRWSKSGLRGTAAHYSWQANVKKYIKEVKVLTDKRIKASSFGFGKSRLPSVNRILICDIDNTLIGNPEALQHLTYIIKQNKFLGFGVATGRRLESALEVLEEWNVPTPDILITSVGTDIHYGHGMVQDSGWLRQIDYRWNPKAVTKALMKHPGIELQPKIEQSPLKVSYNVDVAKFTSVRDIRSKLRHLDLHVKLIYSHSAYLDILPIRASKGLAIRYISMKWGIAPECMLVAGDSGNDEEMLSGNTLGVVVGNYSPELKRLQGRPRIHFAEAECALGVIEGINFYNFLGEIKIPNDE